jgi:hypothetical protein
MNDLIPLRKLRFKRLAVTMIVTLLRDRRFAFNWFECCPGLFTKDRGACHTLSGHLSKQRPLFVIRDLIRSD